MTLNDRVDQLQRLWQAAALPVPLIVVGGGRWGRTWLSVVSRARGSCRGLVIVGRSDPDDLRAWAAGRENLAGLQIAESLDEAIKVLPDAVAAIVASRPRDHLRDGLAALQHGLHVLVEKPLGDTAEAGRALLSAAENARRNLCIGTEFAFLPALQQCAAELGVNTTAINLRLDWHDQGQELRHGALKVRHGEVCLLVDLLSHAISIFQIFAPSAEFRVVQATQNTDGTEGYLQLDDASGGRYELVCGSAADKRVRALTIESGTKRARIDFSADVPTIIIDETSLPSSEDISAFSSTLRLELGAFLLDVTGDSARTFISSGAETIVPLQGQLESLLQS